MCVCVCVSLDISICLYRFVVGVLITYMAWRIRFGSVPNGSVESPVHAVPVHPVHCPYPVRAVPVHPVRAVQPVWFKAGSLGAVRFGSVQMRHNRNHFK